MKKPHVPCPVCGTSATLVRERRPVKYGRRTVCIDDEMMACSDCGERFYVGNQLEASEARVRAQIRSEGGILPFEILALRDRLGLRQAELEELLGVGPKTVSRWENGRVVPDRTTTLLLRALEADPGIVRTLVKVRGAELPAVHARRHRRPRSSAAKTA